MGWQGPTQFCCSLSRVVVSSGPFSGLSEGEDCWDLEGTEVSGGFVGHSTVLTEEGDVWEREEWLLREGLI